MHYNHLQLSKTLWGIQQTIVCFFIILLSFAQFSFPFILFHLHKVDKTIRTNKFCKATSEFRTGFHQFMPEGWLERYICRFRRFLGSYVCPFKHCCFGVVLSDVWHSVICRSDVCRFFVCHSDICRNNVCLSHIWLLDICHSDVSLCTKYLYACMTSWQTFQNQ